MNAHKMRIAAWLIPLMLLGAVVALSRQDAGPPGPPPMPPGPGMDGRMFLPFLNLTDAQKSQVSAIDAAERAKTESFVAQLHDARTAIQDAVADGQFDEQKIRDLATAEAQIQIELTVAQARRQAAIYQILTAEQKTTLAKLKAARSPRGFAPGYRPEQ